MFAKFVQLFAMPAPQNVPNIKMNIAKNVRKPANNARLNAKKWRHK
jgi:hypothetical protein